LILIHKILVVVLPILEVRLSKGHRPLHTNRILRFEQDLLGDILLILIASGAGGPTSNFPPFDPLPNFLHLLRNILLNGLLIPGLCALYFLEHILYALSSLLIVEFNEPLNLFLLVEGIIVVFLGVEHAQHGGVVRQVLQLLFEEALLGGVLARVVVLDPDLVQLEQLGGHLRPQRLGRLQLHLGH
jgi:hypothetical protein